MVLKGVHTCKILPVLLLSVLGNIGIQSKGVTEQDGSQYFLHFYLVMKYLYMYFYFNLKSQSEF